ncbi:sensor histidine kinase [Ruminococcus sp. 5_1_39BFAA]|uniref:sensor histidine kinase n=1 Tax=Ruminococcus sp. 5_1_39BFAA TaxID=457412 RepID=UPI003564D9D5
MIKKLRMKFIALTMFSLLMVLLVIIGTINLLNYKRIVENADSVLAILSENNGIFPKMNNDRRNDGFNPMSPELPYETRYFSVLIDSTGKILAADMGQIAAVNKDTAVEYARNVFDLNRQKGFMGNYRFIQKASGDNTRIIFMDCGRNLTTFRTFLWISCAISALGLLAVFCMVALLSKSIVKPFSESYEKQKRFITDAGHEIKTPLTIIDADADVLKLDIGENEWLQDIQKQTQRLAELTNSLVCLSRMEEDQNQFQMIGFPFSDVVSETSQSFQALAKSQNKTFNSRIQPMLSLHGDEKAISQLISILLDNALKYSSENGDISLSLEKHNKNIRLSVYNTTEFISQENLKYLFDRFYRTDPSRNSGTGGYGIGLSIAKTIVTAHKGKITASTQDEHSLTITVTFPFSQAKTF